MVKNVYAKENNGEAVKAYQQSPTEENRVKKKRSLEEAHNSVTEVDLDSKIRKLEAAPEIIIISKVGNCPIR